MKKTTVTTNKSFDYICEGRDCGTIDTGFGHYSFVLDENRLRMWDGYGWCFDIRIIDKDATVYYRDEVDLKAALNIL